MNLSCLSRRRFLSAAATIMACAFALNPLAKEACAQNPEYQEIKDVVYKTVGDRQITLNLYLPIEEGSIVKGRPLLIFLNSGCWRSPGPGDGWLWNLYGARSKGFAIASVSHRSIDEPGGTFPAPMEDVRAAVRFLRKHASEYGDDPERFAVMGASSGGHLSLTLGVSDEKTPYNVGDNLDVSGQVQRVIDIYGPSDFSDCFARYPVETIDCIYQAFGAPREEGDASNPGHAALIEKAKAASPLYYVDANFAPTLIIHGTQDQVVPLSQSAIIFERMQWAHVRSQFIVTDGGVHSIESIGANLHLAREIFEFLGW